LPRAQPDRVVGDVHRQPAVGQQAQRLRLVPVHVVDGHGDDPRGAANREHPAVRLLSSGAGRAGNLDVEGQRRGPARAALLAHPCRLPRGHRPLEGWRRGAADRGRREGPPEIQRERVSEAAIGGVP
jgi:hypothetical protein